MNKELDINDLITNSVIFVGKKEYRSDDIFRDKTLYSFFNKLLFTAPVSDMINAIKENKIIYIKTNSDMTEATFDYK